MWGWVIDYIVVMTTNTNRQNSKPQASTRRRIIATWVATIGTDCAACGHATVIGGASKDPWTLHRGHIVSHANGGSSSIANLLPICARCNSAMGEDDWTTSGAPMLKSPVATMVADPGPQEWPVAPWKA